MARRARRSAPKPAGAPCCCSGDQPPTCWSISVSRAGLREEIPGVFGDALLDTVAEGRVDCFVQQPDPPVIGGQPLAPILTISKKLGQSK